MDSSVSMTSKIKQIPIGKIFLPPDFMIFHTDSFVRPGLYKSILEKGILEPIWVYDDGGKFIIIHGFKRHHLALHFNHAFIPCLVFSVV